ncbi:selenocysteine lyase isoform X2 [Protopterus annectens]|uniref:selenocysteine lyase isoform X2 n=1 Tax=Protopterus annectens TaxID=7888 RepID=UPI001CFAD259|nr:selenocysteine lyase isoform X2 [Protopterus annectens]
MQVGENTCIITASGDGVNETENDLPHKRIYMDYNATTPLEPEVIEAVTEAMKEAWGNPSSTYEPGRKAKEILDWSRTAVACMVGGKPDDIIFTSGGTEANNLVFHTAVNYFKDTWKNSGQNSLSADRDAKRSLPHFIISNVEHDSVKLVVEKLQKDGKGEVTFVPVSKVSGRAEVEDVISAVRPTTCLVSVMMANNETGVIMPISEIGERLKVLNQSRKGKFPRILFHTDAAQAIGKVHVDVEELGVDYLTIVGHKFYGPRIGALYVRGPAVESPLFPMFFGGGQERNFRPGTENTPMIAGLGKDAFGKQRIHFNSHFEDTDVLPNTCNVSIIGPSLQGRKVLFRCRRLLASVGAACHSDKCDKPSHILLSCGISYEIASCAVRLSVGRATTKEEVDVIVKDLVQAVARLEPCNPGTDVR